MLNKASIVTMYAVTPCHAGSGSALGVVDLPIQRERHTNWPMIQASGVKGAFRSNYEKGENVTDSDLIFGPCKSGADNSGWQGACSFSDAKILAYPMRSNVSPFVWITSPAILKRLARDLDAADKAVSIDWSKFVVKDDEALLLSSETKFNDALVEDWEVKIAPDNGAEKEFSDIKSYFKDADRLLLVSDKVFNYGVTDCTQIMAQIKIDSKTGTTSDGSLRYQEELPSDTIMYSVIYWGDSKNGNTPLKNAEEIKEQVQNVVGSHIQIAGDETCGRGIFQLEWHD